MNPKISSAVFVINLDRRTDRLDEITENLGKFDIPFTRISAFDASINVETLLSLVDWEKSYIYDFFRLVRAGAVGCFLSHRGIWQKMVDDNISQALILEDDAVPLKTFNPEILNVDLSTLGLDCLRLEELDGHEKIIPIPTMEKRTPLPIGAYKAAFRPSHGTAALLLTQEGARKMLTVEKYWFDLDHFEIWETVTGLRTAILEPAMFKQSASASDISRPRRSGRQNLLRAISQDILQNDGLGPRFFRLAVRLNAFALLPWPLRRVLVRHMLRRQLKP